MTPFLYSAPLRYCGKFAGHCGMHAMIPLVGTDAVHSRFRMLHECCIATIFATAVIGECARGPLDILASPIAFVTVVLLMGVPHGALDVEIAATRRKLGTRQDLAVFLLVYVGLAAAVVALWSLAPAVTLATFLLASGYHFGGDWHSGSMHRTVTGCAVLAATSVCHGHEVAEIFGWLAPRAAAELIAAGMALVALPLAAAASTMAARRGMAYSAACEFAMVLTGAYALPPLTFFVLYFCLLHSVRHFAGTMAELSPRSAVDLARAGLPYALLAICGCLLMAAFAAHRDPGPALISSVFVALAALTVPHMVLAETNQRRTTPAAIRLT